MVWLAEFVLVRKISVFDIADKREIMIFLRNWEGPPLKMSEMTSDRSRTEVTAEEYSQNVIQNVRNNMIELTKLSHEQKVRIFISCIFEVLYTSDVN